MRCPTPRAQASSGHRVDAKETELHLLPAPSAVGKGSISLPLPWAPSGWG